MATITVYPEENPRNIFINSPATEITQQELLNLCRNWEQEQENLPYPKLINASGKEELGGGVLVGITNALQNARIAFDARTTSISSGTATSANAGTTLIDTSATFITDGVKLGALIINFSDLSVATVLKIDSEQQITHQQLADGTGNNWEAGDIYKIWNIIQVEASGGNLTAVDSVGITMSPLLPTAFTQVVKTSSSSATLSELMAIQYSSYQNGVTIDVTNGKPGTAYPIGTPDEPVDNLSDAKTIASTCGFDTLYVVGSLTIGASDDISNYNIVGKGATLNVNKTSITLTSGCITANTQYVDLYIQGRQNGESTYHECVIGNLTNVHCEFYLCNMIGPIQNTNASWTQNHIAQYIDCTTTYGFFIMDYNGSPLNQAHHNLSGNIKIINCTNPLADIEILLISGTVWIDSSCTAGNITVTGSGKVQNDSAGSTITDNTTSPSSIWNELTSSHATPGTFGEKISKQMLTLAKFLGLK